LPFLKPAILSAAVLAFLASFENYNTTVFTIVSESTLTTFLAGKVRHGINPSISALAVIIVLITLLGAALHEVLKRREAAASADAANIAAGRLKHRRRAKPFMLEPAVVLILLVFAAGLGSAYFAGSVGVEECKAQVKAEKIRQAQERTRQLERKAMFQNAPAASEAAGQQQSVDKSQRAGVSAFQGVFDVGNLQDQAGAGDGDTEPRHPRSPLSGGGDGGIFAPQNLNRLIDSGGAGDDSDTGDSSNGETQ